MGRQCMRNGSLAIDLYDFHYFNSGGNQRMPEGLSFEDDVKALNVKLDHSILYTKLGKIMHTIEQNSNVNAYNTSHVICDLGAGYHASYTCIQVQNVVL